MGITLFNKPVRIVNAYQATNIFYRALPSDYKRVASFQFIKRNSKLRAVRFVYLNLDNSTNSTFKVFSSKGEKLLDETVLPMHEYNNSETLVEKAYIAERNAIPYDFVLTSVPASNCDIEVWVKSPINITFKNIILIA